MEMKKITIFEGCDGSGKTTAAKAFAEKTGALYVHCGPFNGVTDNLARFYVDAIMPAIMGFQDVVLDRSWHSERPYGVAYRDGNVRLSNHDIRVLERLSMRCDPVLVYCNPGWGVVSENFAARKGLEMLKDSAQLLTVFNIYDEILSLESSTRYGIPIHAYDYTQSALLNVDLINDSRTLGSHPIDVVSGGSWHAETVVVGRSTVRHANSDTLYRWPFGSFGNGLCQELSGLLDIADVKESDVLWVDADQDLSFIHDLDCPNVICTDAEAYKKLYALKVMTKNVQHPLLWLSGDRKVPCDLISYL